MTVAWMAECCFIILSQVFYEENFIAIFIPLSSENSARVTNRVSKVSGAVFIHKKRTMTKVEIGKTFLSTPHAIRKNIGYAKGMKTFHYISRIF
jgi:hypothetical protein